MRRWLWVQWAIHNLASLFSPWWSDIPLWGITRDQIRRVVLGGLVLYVVVTAVLRQ